MVEPKNRFQTSSLDEMIDKHVGEIGTKNRDDFERKLKKGLKT